MQEVQRHVVLCFFNDDDDDDDDYVNVEATVNDNVPPRQRLKSTLIIFY